MTRSKTSATGGAEGAVASPAPADAITRIVVRIQVGDHRMAGSDDPVFLRLFGPEGREFRLLRAKGRALRRGQEDVLVFAGPDDPDTNVANPELNDPRVPSISASAVTGVALTKAQEPLPNVRGLGEMDDRLQIAEAAVELHVTGQPKPLSFGRRGPIWLGLSAGRVVALPQIDGEP